MDHRHVPAWKRLGLKLKNSEPETSQPNKSIAVSNRPKHGPDVEGRNDIQPRKKMRFSDSGDKQMSVQLQNAKPAKKSETPNVLKKRVSFTTDTKTADGDSARPAVSPALLSKVHGASKNDRSTSKKSYDDVDHVSSESAKAKHKAKRKASTMITSKKPHATLEYLDHFHTEHGSWKFNKNREVWILKHALSETDIPRSYNFALARYIYGLKSTSARQRLLDECVKAAEAETDDEEQDGLETDEKGGLDSVEFVRYLHNLAAGFDNVEAEREMRITKWAENQRRTDILRWALGNGRGPVDNGRSGQLTNKASTFEKDELVKTSHREWISPPPSYSSAQSIGQSQGKRTERRERRTKKRTAAVDYSSSSSSDSSSEGSNNDSSGSVGSSGSEGSNGSSESSGSAGSG